MNVCCFCLPRIHSSLSWYQHLISPLARHPMPTFRLVGANPGLLVLGISQSTHPFPHHSYWFREGSVTQDNPMRLSSVPFAITVKKEMLFLPAVYQAVGISLEFLGIMMWNKVRKRIEELRNREKDTFQS